MDYKAIAKAVYENIGGKDNLVSAAHCATRLRLVIADNDKCNTKAVEELDGVKGVFFASGQLQVIFGTGVVNKVYEEFRELAGIEESSKEEVKQAASAKQNLFQRAIKTIGDVFVPIIPAIVASGLLMGLLEGLCNLYPAMADSTTYTILHLFSNAAFTYLPILIAISAAKVFGGNLFLGAVIGMIMIHPDLLNAWATSGVEIPKADVWFGLYQINMVGYQGHVIPVVIAVWLMSKLEKKLHQIVPEIIDLFVTPLVTVLVTGYLTLTIVGPVFSTLENGVLDSVRWLITLPFGLGGLVCGGLYAVTVVAGLHHMYNALEAGLLSSVGFNMWMPIATAANVAQGAACLALSIKTKNKKLKAIALPASLSSYMGITEPAIFGVNIRYGKAFISGCIGGACGALVAGILGVQATAYGITGIFGFLITTKFIWQYAVVMIVASVVAFVLSWISYKEEVEEVSARPELTLEDTKENTVYSPLEGNAIPLTTVNDATFAGEVLGKGYAVVPKTGRVVAPFDAKVETLFDTKHAIGLTSKDGIEVLIHVGINTVELNGQCFNAYVAEGDEVKAGQLLLEFDINGIKEAGYDTTTPVIVTNTFDYAEVKQVKEGEITFLEESLVVEK
ncbi:PTS system, sucrose-specific IIB component [Lachnospiraceae bacterium KM106-2]|nr:PTS system, sucrose-specific IIB component [Lachnospiraceae bacterium KM106-2]